MIEALLAGALIGDHGVIREAALIFEDGRITAAGARAELSLPPQARVHDYGDAVLAPGYIDVHVHGGGGYDLMQAGADGIAAVERHLARHGVTGFLATTMTAPWEQVLAAVGRLGRTSLGIHLEGPFISPRRAGVHPPPDLLTPTVERLNALWERSQGRLRLITLAPELEGAAEFIRAAARLGIVVSLGHSDATLEQAQAGFAAGARHVTHTFNAMRPLHHREPGLLGAALTDDSVYAEIIADGIHVHPRMVEMFLRAKGPERALLVSDGISAAGCGDGRYPLGSLTVEVGGGRCLLGGHLAGSVLILDQAVRNVMDFAGWDLAAAARLAARNPARLIGAGRKGRLAAGMDADIVVLSPQGAVIAAYQAGQKVN